MAQFSQRFERPLGCGFYGLPVIVGLIAIVRAFAALVEARTSEALHVPASERIRAGARSSDFPLQRPPTQIQYLGVRIENSLCEAGPAE
jgi:hypothetical protein